jgi:hypothetical protein
MTPDFQASPASRIEQALKENRAVDYGTSPDNEFPEITWQQLGLFDSNEIAVVARVGTVVVVLKETSALLLPHMQDRVFGIDVADQQLALSLSAKVWEQHGPELSREALRIRAANGA